MNYFELFELPVSLKVDKTLLAKKFFELQKKFHPDFFTQSTEFEQAEALEKSALVNKALITLKNDEETIKYVLLLKGIMEKDEKYQLPPAFLMEVMELNEELSQNSKKQIETIEDAINAPVKNIIENYNENTTAEDLLKVKEYYYKKKYLQRILDRING